MLSKNKIKLIQGLNSKKQRAKTGLFIVEGKKSVEAVVSSLFEVEEIYASSTFLEENPSFSELAQVQEADESAIQKASHLSSNKAVIALVRLPQQKALNDWKTQQHLVLDGINDPGNLGTIIRTAAWFGIKSIICSEDTADCFNPKVVQSSMGALFSLTPSYIKLEQLFSEASNEVDFNIYGAYLAGEKASTINKEAPCFIVLGSESHGIRPALSSFITQKICIPAAVDTNEESLNVAIANAILLYELNR